MHITNKKLDRFIKKSSNLTDCSMTKRRAENSETWKALARIPSTKEGGTNTAYKTQQEKTQDLRRQKWAWNNLLSYSLQNISCGQFQRQPFCLGLIDHGEPHCLFALPNTLTYLLKLLTEKSRIHASLTCTEDKSISGVSR